MQGVGRMTRDVLRKAEKEATELSQQKEENPTLFHWGDALLGEQANCLHPLALVARAFSLLDAISARAARHGIDSSDTIQEIRFAFETLIKAGEFLTAGQFLTSLETAIPTEERELWPLSAFLAADTLQSALLGKGTPVS